MAFSANSRAWQEELGEVVESRADARRRHGADDPIDDLSVSKEEERRQAQDAEARRELRLIVDVHFRDDNVRRELASEGINMWRENAARRTPIRGEVDEGQAARLLDNRSKALRVKVWDSGLWRAGVRDGRVDGHATPFEPGMTGPQ